MSFGDLPDQGTLLGHVGDQEVLLVRAGEEVFAVSPHCTHYQGPLAEGLVVGSTVRCPWHHACFDLRSGEALHAPAIDPIACWDIDRSDGMISVRAKRQVTKSKHPDNAQSEPKRIVILGSGAAGFAAAEMLRRQGYQGSLVMVSCDKSLPYDRPNLSKDYLAGTAPFEYVPLKDERFYTKNSIETRLVGELHDQRAV